MMLLGIFLNGTISFGQTLNVTSSTTLSSNASYTTINVNQGGSLTVNNGAVLAANRINIYPGGSMTVTGSATVDMAASGSSGLIQVYAQPFTPPTSYLTVGGRLTVNNATITSSTGSWKGISVTGNRDINDPFGVPAQDWQAISQSNSRIAKATFINAIIRKTIWGVCNFDILYTNTAGGTNGAGGSGGGVIQATSTDFSGNVGFAVWMQHYRNFLNTSQGIRYVNDQSYFVGCKFSRVAGTINQGLDAFMCFHEVNGINVLGNEFTLTSPNSAPAKTYPYSGIYIQNAGVNIDEYCTAPFQLYGQRCTSAIASTFTGLQDGIVNDAGYGQNGAFRVNVQHSTFENCRTGINLSGTVQSNIVENDFTLSPESNYNNTAVFLGGCTGYKVEGNQIKVSGSSNTRTYGIAVKNSGAAPNSVYRNTIEDTRYALQGIDWNRNSNVITSVDGLRFLCNTMSNGYPNNSYDVIVARSSTSSVVGIAGLQANVVGGTPVDAGNTFSNFSGTITPRNYVNSGLSILYVGNIPSGNYTSNTINIASGNSYSCPSTFNGQIPVAKTAVEFGTLREELKSQLEDENITDKGDLLAQYAQLHYDMLDFYYGVWNEEGLQDIDSALWVLSTAEYLPEFQIQKASLQASKGEWEEALYTLGEIPTNFSLSEEEVIDLEQFTVVYQAGQILADSGYNWELLPSSYKDALKDIVESGGGRARFAARYFFSTYEGVRYEPEVIELNEEEAQNKMAPANAPGTIQNANAADQKVLLYPNPTPDGEVSFSGVEMGSRYSITDLSGRTLTSGTIDGTTATISLARFAVGSYFLQITNAAGKVSTFKIARQ